jgi:hypothetical protein
MTARKFPLAFSSIAKDNELPELGVLNLVWGYIINLPRKIVYEILFEASS